MDRRTVIATALVLGLAGGASFGHGGWIYAKGRLAQVLLLRAWAAARGGARRPAPWPWADTWPGARLRVPRLGVDEIVLAGASGRTMAFGPAHLDGSVPPGGRGNCVLTGHRDTHFAFLEHLRPGDVLIVERVSGPPVRYTVTRTEILDEDDVEVMGERQRRTLTLLTCYPFHALVPGGPGRYAVIARASSPQRRVSPTRNPRNGDKNEPSPGDYEAPQAARMARAGKIPIRPAPQRKNLRPGAR